MALTIGTRFPQAPGTFQTLESLTQSTATAFQTLSNEVEVSSLGMGTATGDNSNNLYALNATTTASGVEGDGVEGAYKLIYASATGEAAVFIDGPTQGRLPANIALDALPTATAIAQASATGNWVFSTDGDMILCRFVNGKWNYVALTGATQATAT
jgi:hypothetical protein